MPRAARIADYALSTKPCEDGHHVVSIGYAGDTATFELYDARTGLLDAVVYYVNGIPRCVFGSGSIRWSGGAAALRECRFADSVDCP